MEVTAAHHTFSVKPYWKAYLERYHEKPNGVLTSRISKVFAILDREYGTREVLTRFRRYLDRTAPEWFSPPRFAETWAAWAPRVEGAPFLPYHPVSNGRRYLTPDELDARAGIPVPPRPAA